MVVVPNLNGNFICTVIKHLVRFVTCFKLIMRFHFSIFKILKFNISFKRFYDHNIGGGCS